MIQKAISHYKYGISHDIFKEPVTSYAALAVVALEKQVPMKPMVKSVKFDEAAWYCCPTCGATICCVDHHINRDKYCNQCGQAWDWSD